MPAEADKAGVNVLADALERRVTVRSKDREGSARETGLGSGAVSRDRSAAVHEVGDVLQIAGEGDVVRDEQLRGTPDEPAASADRGSRQAAGLAVEVQVAEIGLRLAAVFPKADRGSKFDGAAVKSTETADRHARGAVEDVRGATPIAEALAPRDHQVRACALELHVQAADRDIEGSTERGDVQGFPLHGQDCAAETDVTLDARSSRSRRRDRTIDRSRRVRRHRGNGNQRRAHGAGDQKLVHAASLPEHRNPPRISGL